MSTSFNRNLEYPPYPSTDYIVAPGRTANKLSHLMKIVMTVRQNEQWNQMINDIVKKDPSQLDAINGYKMTALMMAVANCRTYSSIECVKLLLELGANMECADHDGANVFDYVCSYDDVNTDCLQVLIFKAKELNIFNRSTHELLDRPYIFENKMAVEFITMLLKHGYDPNHKNHIGLTPLSEMCRSNNFSNKIAKLLIKYGADIYSKTKDTGMTAFDCAIECEKIKPIKFLLKVGFDINEKDSRGRTPLANVLLKNIRSNDFIIGLIDLGASVDNVDTDGKNIIHYLVSHKIDSELLQKVLKSGAEINCADCRGWTPLIQFITSNKHYGTYIHSLSTLIDAGADVNEVDADGMTPLIHLYRIHNIDEDIRLEASNKLIKAGANLNDIDMFGNTALMYCCYSGFAEAVGDIKLLLDSGSECDIVNRYGETALIILCKSSLITQGSNCDLSIFLYLVEKSTKVIKNTDLNKNSAYDYFINGRNSRYFLTQMQLNMLKGC